MMNKNIRYLVKIKRLSDSLIDPQLQHYFVTVESKLKGNVTLSNEVASEACKCWYRIMNTASLNERRRLSCLN